jgi:kumamolisin
MVAGARVQADTRIDLTVHLALRNEADLDAFLERQRTPGNPDFGRALSQEEFAARYLPTDEDIEHARAVFKRQGFRVHPNAHAGALRIGGTIADAERAFSTEIRHFPKIAAGQEVRAPVKPLVMPEGLRVLAVHGLATPAHRHSHARRHSEVAPLQSGPYSANDIRRVYSVPDNARGAGQVIGLIELDGYDHDDVNFYAQENGLPHPNLVDIMVDGFNGVVQDAGGQEEVTLDIELVAAMAPDAAELRVYQAGNYGNAFFDLWNEIANPTLGDKKLVPIISCSWGVPEDQLSSADVQSEAALFRQMVAQGQTVFAASGDSGARDDGQHLVTDDPASQPFVVGVGGTSLTTDRATGGRSSESAWAEGGGGVSCWWPVVPWQTPALVAAANGSTTSRNVPDVSAVADPATGHAVYVAGKWFVIGGTSCAAPLWSGMLGAVNGARQAAGKGALNPVAPLLYGAGAASFYDVADGSTNGFYPAVPGFDNATGLGPFSGGALIQALTADP